MLLFRRDNAKMSISKCVSQGHTIKQQCIDYHYNFRKHMQILEFIENDLNYIQKDTQLNSQNFAFPATIAHYAAIFVTLIFGDLRTNLQCAREIMKTQYFLGAPNPLETSRKQLECKTSALSKNVPAKKIKTHQFNSCIHVSCQILIFNSLQYIQNLEKIIMTRRVRPLIEVHSLPLIKVHNVLKLKIIHSKQQFYFPQKLPQCYLLYQPSKLLLHIVIPSFVKVFCCQILSASLSARSYSM
ncbi:Hypothetical_protein [Hexamita inflata]|uniref:Hypothetical_protein n=1 Tax=Hexamita inflata TaxID=28002 RepID=A0AA86PBT2_9EUKA|nr:Hypothetical protein HINF_LOCUS22511 [Hexamita inflata]